MPAMSVSANSTLRLHGLELVGHAARTWCPSPSQLTQAPSARRLPVVSRAVDVRAMRLEAPNCSCHRLAARFRPSRAAHAGVASAGRSRAVGQGRTGSSGSQRTPPPPVASSSSGKAPCRGCTTGTPAARGLEHVQPEGLAVGRGDRQHGEGTQEVELLFLRSTLGRNSRPRSVRPARASVPRCSPRHQSSVIVRRAARRDAQSGARAHSLARASSRRPRPASAGPCRRTCAPGIRWSGRVGGRGAGAGERGRSRR